MFMLAWFGKKQCELEPSFMFFPLFKLSPINRIIIIWARTSFPRDHKRHAPLAISHSRFYYVTMRIIKNLAPLVEHCFY